VPIPSSLLHLSYVKKDIRKLTRTTLQNDAILFITFSGRTAEILNVLPHVPLDVPVIVLTSHTSEATCALLDQRPDTILLPGPIHESEEASFGVSAPTTSTTVAIAIGDMLAITAADKYHEGRTKQIFHRNHPGGAIGVKAKEASQK
jgi:D-arabinose 5-phosphate isomerase GutQ